MCPTRDGSLSSGRRRCDVSKNAKTHYLLASSRGFFVNEERRKDRKIGYYVILCTGIVMINRIASGFYHQFLALRGQHNHFF